MHVHFARRAHALRRPPYKFILGRRVRESNQLLGNMFPLSVVSLPQSFWILLPNRESGAHEKQHQTKSYPPSAHGTPQSVVSESAHGSANYRPPRLGGDDLVTAILLILLENERVRHSGDVIAD